MRTRSAEKKGACARTDPARLLLEAEHHVQRAGQVAELHRAVGGTRVGGTSVGGTRG